MANKIQLKRGVKSRLSTLSSGEPAFTTDTRELFLGTSSGNINMSGSKWYNGTDMSGTSVTSTYSYIACPQVKVGDMYLNTTTGGVYECSTAGGSTGAKWMYKGCIKGTDGGSGNDSLPIVSDSNENVGVYIPVLEPLYYSTGARVSEALSPGVYWIKSKYIVGDPIDEYNSIESEATGEIFTATVSWLMSSEYHYLVRLTSDHKIMILDKTTNLNVSGQTMFLRTLAKVLKPYLT